MPPLPRSARSRDGPSTARSRPPSRCRTAGTPAAPLGSAARYRRLGRGRPAPARAGVQPAGDHLLARARLSRIITGTSPRATFARPGGRRASQTDPAGGSTSGHPLLGWRRADGAEDLPPRRERGEASRSRGRGAPADRGGARGRAPAVGSLDLQGDGVARHGVPGGGGGHDRLSGGAASGGSRPVPTGSRAIQRWTTRRRPPRESPALRPGREGSPPGSRPAAPGVEPWVVRPLPARSASRSFFRGGRRGASRFSGAEKDVGPRQIGRLKEHGLGWSRRRSW